MDSDKDRAEAAARYEAQLDRANLWRVAWQLAKLAPLAALLLATALLFWVNHRVNEKNRMTVFKEVPAPGRSPPTPPPAGPDPGP